MPEDKDSKKERDTKSWETAHRALSSEHDRLQGVLAETQGMLRRYQDELARETHDHIETRVELNLLTKDVKEAHELLGGAGFGSRGKTIEKARGILKRRLWR